jgi:hypothetical protein
MGASCAVGTWALPVLCRESVLVCFWVCRNTPVYLRARGAMAKTRDGKRRTDHRHAH